MYKVKFIIIKPDSFRSEFGWLGIRYILAELKKVPDISVSIDLISDKEQDDILARLHKHPPDIIGMPAFQLNLNTIRSLTAKIKSILPHVHITLGNIEATIHQETLFNYLPHMDSLVVGEGEYSFRELVERLQNHRSLQGCEGLLYRKGTEIVRNKMRPLEQNIDTFAFPDRDILPPFTSGFQVFDVITSRGCNGNCTFCNNQNFRMQPGPHARYRSIKNVLDEIEELKSRYKAAFFSLSDDTFGDPGPDGENRLEQFADGLEERNISIRFRIQIRAELINQSNRESLLRLKRLGLDSVFIGIESGNKPDLKLYGKTATLAENIQAIYILNKLEIACSIGFIMFNPYSDFIRLYDNLKFLEASEVLITPYLLNHKLWLFNGTPIYKKVSRDRLLKNSADIPLTNGFLYNFMDTRIHNAWDALFALDSHPVNFLRIDHVFSFYRFMSSEDSIFRRRDSVKKLGAHLQKFKKESRRHLIPYTKNVLQCAADGRHPKEVLADDEAILRQRLTQAWEETETAYQRCNLELSPRSQAQYKLKDL